MRPEGGLRQVKRIRILFHNAEVFWGSGLQYTWPRSRRPSCLLLFRFLLLFGFNVHGLRLAVQGFLSLAFRVGDEVLEFPCRDVFEEHLINFLK